ncbi:MAG: threonylcarbamoyl-AMP synthase [Clostridia bacterium]|nr:threonylcarbamoyl-AMP synthase [Clostridia bacterium]
MTTEVIKINPLSFGSSELEAAAEIIRSGGLVIFPTETVYGIGADATSSECARKIYAAKGRPSDNPLIIHIADPRDAEKYAVTSPLYVRLAEQFMPGPITVIMPKKDIIPFTVTGGLDSVAVRCPSHPIAHELIRLSGVPVAAPSANISGRPSATGAEYAIADFDGRADMIIDGGESDFGLESTIVKITGDDSLLLLRPGAVTRDALLCVCERVDISDTVTRMLKENERPVCPGMKYRHYAPSKPLVLVEGTPEDRIRFFREKQRTENAVIICYDEQKELLLPGSVISTGREDDLLSQGHEIFRALRVCDSLPGDIIYANLPGTEGFGLALYNRLIRAAAHTVVRAEKT